METQKVTSCIVSALAGKTFTSISHPQNDRKTHVLRANSLLQLNTQHPSVLFPDTKDALLDTLHEKWEVDPVRRAALLVGQQTPRYLKVSNNGKRCDPLENLERLVNRERY